MLPKAAAPWVARDGGSLGKRILEAVEASFAVANCNTNLGILLLCVPLAVAAEQRNGSQDLRQRLAAVLRDLDRNDASDVFRAIVKANPAGLGEVDSGDVASRARYDVARSDAFGRRPRSYSARLCHGLCGHL